MNEFNPNGFYTISNAGGIEVEVNESGDGVRYRFNYGQDDLENEEIYEAEIIYEPDEDDPMGDFIAGWMHGETFYPLNLVMRTYNY